MTVGSWHIGLMLTHLTLSTWFQLVPLLFSIDLKELCIKVGVLLRDSNLQSQPIIFLCVVWVGSLSREIRNERDHAHNKQKVSDPDTPFCRLKKTFLWGDAHHRSWQRLGWQIWGSGSLVCDTHIRLYFFLGREIWSAKICDSSMTKHGKSGSHSVV